MCGVLFWCAVSVYEAPLSNFFDEGHGYIQRLTKTIRLSMEWPDICFNVILKSYVNHNCILSVMLY